MHLDVPDGRARQILEPHVRNRGGRGERAIANGHAQRGNSILVAQACVVRIPHESAGGINNLPTRPVTMGDHSESAVRGQQAGAVGYAELAQNVRLRRGDDQVVAIRTGSDRARVRPATAVRGRFGMSVGDRTHSGQSGSGPGPIGRPISWISRRDGSQRLDAAATDDIVSRSSFEQESTYFRWFLINSVDFAGVKTQRCRSSRNGVVHDVSGLA